MSLKIGIMDIEEALVIIYHYEINQFDIDQCGAIWCESLLDYIAPIDLETIRSSREFAFKLYRRLGLRGFGNYGRYSIMKQEHLKFYYDMANKMVRNV